MEIGMFGINMGACSYPDGLRRAAGLAEELGYDSLWAGEHMVVPSPRVPPSPMEPTDRMLDPVPALTYAAAVTNRVLLGTGVLLIPQRNPVALAKELASLDVLCEGRLRLGVGVGYLEPEMRAVGVPMEDRAARTVEHLGAMRALWSMEAPAYHGRYVAFEGIDAHPRPVRGDIPVVMGGRTPPAYRRAVAFSLGWYGFALDPEGAAECLAGLRAAADIVERRADLDRLEISVTPRGPLRDGWLDRFSELGVDRLILMAPGTLDLAGLEAWLEANAPAALGV